MLLSRFPMNSNGAAPFHHTMFDYSCTDLGGFHDHIRNVPWKGIFNLAAFPAIHFTVSIRSKLICFDVVQIVLLLCTLTK